MTLPVVASARGAAPAGRRGALAADRRRSKVGFLMAASTTPSRASPTSAATRKTRHGRRAQRRLQLTETTRPSCPLWLASLATGTLGTATSPSRPLRRRSRCSAAPLQVRPAPRDENLDAPRAVQWRRRAYGAVLSRPRTATRRRPIAIGDDFVQDRRAGVQGRRVGETVSRTA